MSTFSMAKKEKRIETQSAAGESNPRTVQAQKLEDMQDALKDIFGPVFEAMLQGEMSSHSGYFNNERGEKETQNRRNDYTKKTLKATAGDFPFEVPRDREGTFEPIVVPKRKRDVSAIEDKVLAVYAKGMSQRDIADTIKGIYGFEICHEKISEITDSVLEQPVEWQNRPLNKFYTFLFIDCLYVTVRKDYETKNYAVYVIPGYDVDGQKDILGLWLSESESKHQWMQVFDEIKNRGVEDALFLSVDGVSDLEEGAKAVFPNVMIQRCIVHLIRNAIKYVPDKDYKGFTAQLKKSTVQQA